MRKRKHDDHINHEAWAIPYADLMTLLLAFFVVMYAVSVVNEGKYRVMSQSMSEAFNGTSHVIVPLPKRSATPRNVDPALAAPPGQAGAAVAPIAIPIPLHPSSMRVVDVRARRHQKTGPPEPQKLARDALSREAGKSAAGPAKLVMGLVKSEMEPARQVLADPAKPPADQQRQKENLARIRDEVQHALQPLIDRKQVVVRSDPNWLEVEIRTDILFPSGVAQLSTPADQVLSNLAGILAPFSNPLRVEGYTDNVPINTALYPSNWELSAARAASVARLFSEHGVSPRRMGIIGWGQFRPAADNSTAEGRNRNRRVLVVVLSDSTTPTRYSDDARQAVKSLPPVVARRDPAQAAPHKAAMLPVVPSIRPAAVVAGAAILTPTTTAGGAASGTPEAPPMVVTPEDRR